MSHKKTRARERLTRHVVFETYLQLVPHLGCKNAQFLLLQFVGVITMQHSNNKNEKQTQTKPTLLVWFIIKKDKMVIFVAYY